MRKFFLISCFLIIASVSYGTDIVSHAYPSENTYVLVINSYDWGPGADTVILRSDIPVLSDRVFTSDFKVSVLLYTQKKKDEGYGIKKGERKVVDAYLSDKLGNRINALKSEYITLKLYTSPEDKLSDPFTHYVMFEGISDIYGLKIENSLLNVNITKCSGYVSRTADIFDFKTSEHDGIVLNYASYKPETKKKIPLIIWFHGIGEGGTDPFMPVLGANVSNLASPMIQKYFQGGAAVIVPQSPTSWLESESTDPFGNRIWVPVNIEKPVKTFFYPFKALLYKITGTQVSSTEDNNTAASVSYYTKSVKHLIDSYIEENPEIDTDRIYVGGCSAGGYMTVNMVLQYPSFFAAAFPVCEAYPDEKLTEDEIQRLSKIPMWFTYALSDTTIESETHSLNTVKRIKKYNPLELHEIVYDEVQDLTGRYYDSQGKPYVYNGHKVWINVLDDQSLEGNLSLFDWLSLQRK